MKFAASEKEDPEEFIQKLDDCKKCYDISDRDLLKAVPSILRQSASIWFRVNKYEIKTWKTFKNCF